METNKPLPGVQYMGDLTHPYDTINFYTPPKSEISVHTWYNEVGKGPFLQMMNEPLYDDVPWLMVFEKANLPGSISKLYVVSCGKYYTEPYHYDPPNREYDCINLTLDYEKVWCEPPLELPLDEHREIVIVRQAISTFPDIDWTVITKDNDLSGSNIEQIYIISIRG